MGRVARGRAHGGCVIDETTEACRSCLLNAGGTLFEEETDGGFEVGVRNSVEAILASPYFIFRLERQPDNVKPGETYRINDVDLASAVTKKYLGDNRPAGHK